MAELKDKELDEVNGGVVQNISDLTTYGREVRIDGDYGRTWDTTDASKRDLDRLVYPVENN